MPELPEVQTVVNTIGPSLIGRRIEVIRALRADIVSPRDSDLRSLLEGRSITQLARRAKRIVITLDSLDRFYVHLGMTGQLTVSDSGAPLKPHTHLLAELDSGEQMRFVDPRRFGGIFWLGTEPDGDIGPEPLEMRASTLLRQLSGTKRAIKTTLLDQRVIAGIGNIYADESLHRAGVHPLAVACELSKEQVDRLSAAIKFVLRKAIRAGGSTLRDYVNGRGERGSFQDRHRVYDRTGEPCKCCGTAINRAVVGGRSTHWCPTCQRATKMKRR